MEPQIENSEQRAEEKPGGIKTPTAHVWAGDRLGTKKQVEAVHLGARVESVYL